MHELAGAFLSHDFGALGDWVVVPDELSGQVTNAIKASVIVTIAKPIKKTDNERNNAQHR